MRKYYSATPFFENGLVRFTQPSALNDPDEARPELMFGEFAPEDYARAREQAKSAGRDTISNQELERFYLRPFPSLRYDEKSFPGLWPAYELRLRKEPFRTLTEMDLFAARRAVELCLETADKKIGIFSLSPSRDETMWAYYANSHAGIAIDFDCTHEFIAGVAKEVTYSDAPVFVSSNGGMIRVGGLNLSVDAVLNSQIDRLPLKLFLRKKLSWKHESEHRIFKALSDADHVIKGDSNGYPIHLYQVPSDAVLSATFGHRASDEFVHVTLKSISEREKWKNVKVFRRRRTPSGEIKVEQLR
jgi:hypothetical protein